MKRFMMKYFMINCKEATFLMAGKEEKKLSLVKKMKLAFHTSMCSFCKKFDEQISGIGRESRQLHGEDPLPEARKKKILKALQDHSS